MFFGHVFRQNTLVERTVFDFKIEVTKHDLKVEGTDFVVVKTKIGTLLNGITQPFYVKSPDTTSYNPIQPIKCKYSDCIIPTSVGGPRTVIPDFFGDLL